MIKRAHLGCMLFCLAFSANAGARPNIVVIIADDMGYGDLTINGSTVLATPHIDALAETGANFTSFYASANLCTPSRAGLLTGRYPIRTGLAADVIDHDDAGGLPLGEMTIAEVLRAAGYVTGMVGKWHLGNRLPFWPTRQGFDYFFGVQHSNDMPDFALFRGEERLEFPVDQATLTRRYTQEAIRFIEQNRDRPFFLYLAHTFPHVPLIVADDRAGESAAGVYGDVVEELDWSTGEIVATLRRLELFDETIVIFTSDNGAWFEGGSGASRGRKGETWDGAYRVPMVLSWSAVESRGREIVAPAMNIDLLPTLAAAANAELPDDIELDGRNLLPMLAGEPGGGRSLYFFLNEEIVAVRSGRFKLATHTWYRQRLIALENVGVLDGFEGPYPLLFDMLGPTGENYSLAREHPQLTAELWADLRAARERFAPFRTKPPATVFPPPPKSPR